MYGKHWKEKREGERKNYNLKKIKKLNAERKISDVHHAFMMKYYEHQYELNFYRSSITAHSQWKVPESKTLLHL